MMICNREPTPFEAGMQPYLPSRHMGGRLGLCDGHHTGATSGRKPSRHEPAPAPPGCGRIVDCIGPCRSS